MAGHSLTLDPTHRRRGRGKNQHATDEVRGRRQDKERTGEDQQNVKNKSGRCLAKSSRMSHRPHASKEEVAMQSRGFEEAQAVYLSDDPSKLVGQFRRFGEAGPAYEILRIESGDKAWIRVVYSEEELAYPIGEIFADPIAETVP
jgi:hypothetical protein